MRRFIINLGRTRTIILITFIAIGLSVIITCFALHFLGLLSLNLNTFAGLIIAIGAPSIVSPVISWVITGLIFEIHKLEEEMRLLATYDFLTGLLSRRAFIEQADYICRFAERQGLDFSILCIDLDHFKGVNDKYGHAAGDLVLESFGKIMLQCSRESDLAGRIGGEEFAFFLPGTNRENATYFSERLLKSISDYSVRWNNTFIKITASIGVAYFPHKVEIANALAQADKALYNAKRNGRNQVAVYNADMEMEPINVFNKR